MYKSYCKHMYFLSLNLLLSEVAVIINVCFMLVRENELLSPDLQFAARGDRGEGRSESGPQDH